jgi:CheY-like chemotaxis protein
MNRARESNRLKTILIVDDNHYVLNAFKEMMHKWGHRVIAQQDGPSALAVIGQGEAVDLIVTDYQMPGMDGLELVEKLKLAVPTVPVIMMSASLKEEVCLRAMALGVVEFLEKPAEPRALRRIIENAINNAVPGFGTGEEENPAANQ